MTPPAVSAAESECMKGKNKLVRTEGKVNYAAMTGTNMFNQYKIQRYIR